MFDLFKPVPALVNPITGKPILADWQGKDGPRLLLTWTQGTAIPEWNVDAEMKGSETPFWPEQERLPDKFQIYTDEDGFTYLAECLCINGIWSETRLTICGKHDRHGRFTNFLKEG